MRRARRIAALFAAVTLAGSGLVAATTTTATAGDAQCSSWGGDCPDTGGGDGGGDGDSFSDGTKNASLNSGTKSCSVYANGAGMGMYCVHPGAGNAKTLRERYGNQRLQRCRYSELPRSIQTPYNANPDRGRYMLMSCLDNIDFDTYAGGTERTINISLVFVKNGTDTEDRHNEISDFMWNVLDSDTQLPIPFMRTRPNPTPVVGIPTFFTFNWLDPTTKEIVDDGPFAGSSNGGAFREIVEGGILMRARATKVTINPNQEGVEAVTCDPATPYLVGRPPKDQPANSCSIVFPRSSASARKFATKHIPEDVKDAFYADIRVTWEVTYGPVGGAMRELGDGFTMRMRQALPVQEVQAPNQPPAVIY